MIRTLYILILAILLSVSAKAEHKETDHKFYGNSYEAPGSDKYQKLETQLADNELSKFVDKQLKNKKTGLVSYILFENNKIVINKKNWNQEIIENKGLLRSNSMGKSMVGYVAGHAVCKGYIDSINVKVNDWFPIENTLYANNTLLQLLNMTAGDHQIIGEKKYNGDGWVKGNKKKVINNKTVFESMQWFQGSKKKKKKSPYNYSAMTTHVIANYVLQKVGIDNYENFLKEIFTDHVGVKGNVYFNKVESGVRVKNPVSMWAEGKKWKWVSDPTHGNQRYTFFATAEDYLRIAKTIIKDYNSDSCIGNYLRTIYDNRVNKKLTSYDPKSIGPYSRQYGGQFHINPTGIKKDKVIFAMDGFGGQNIVMDMIDNRILVLNSSNQHYNWKKLVLNVIKNW
tara:strand:- start:100 stop:1290 length:1191 start_codon:yes stop_codon:yes gene_type:complete